MVDALPILAQSLFTAASIPRAATIMVLKSSKEHSTVYSYAILMGQAFYILHAIRRGDWGLFWASILGVVTCCVTLYLILRYRPTGHKDPVVERLKQLVCGGKKE
jgi:hypothetical protein